MADDGYTEMRLESPPEAAGEGEATEPTVKPPERRKGNYAAGQQARRDRERAMRDPDAPATAAAPKAAKPRPRAAKASNLDEIKRQVAEQLKGGHELAALFTGLAELRITDQEAAMLAGPFVDTCIELGIPLDGKLWAPLQLIVAGAMVYGPRIGQIRAKVHEQRANAARAVNDPAEPPHAVNGALAIRQ